MQAYEGQTVELSNQVWLVLSRLSENNLKNITTILLWNNLSLQYNVQLVRELPHHFRAWRKKLFSETESRPFLCFTVILIIKPFLLPPRPSDFLENRWIIPHQVFWRSDSGKWPHPNRLEAPPKILCIFFH